MMSRTESERERPCALLKLIESNIHNNECQGSPSPSAYIITSGTYYLCLDIPSTHENEKIVAYNSGWEDRLSAIREGCLVQRVNGRQF